MGLLDLTMLDMNNNKKEQTCSTCRYVSKCYSERAGQRNIVINILACRIRMNINRNESSKVLLRMIKPNLIKLVYNAINKVGTGYIDMDNMIRDLESRVIECLIDENGYRIGESAYLTEYLFGTNPRTGWVKKWILWDFSRHKRFYSKHNLFGTNPKSDTEEDIAENDRAAIFSAEYTNTFEEEHVMKDTINAMLNVIEDGVTLNINEYRVISFCLAHTNESNKIRLIDGTHTYLSYIMGVSRPRITRLYAVAKKKLLKAAVECGISLT